MSDNERNNKFHIHDAGLFVRSSRRTDCPTFGKGGGPDWETWNRLMDVLAAKGFVFDLDPTIDNPNFRSLNKWHRLGRCPVSGVGDLFVAAHVFPAGCEFRFFQEVVTENRHGGRYDFDRVGKMPYLIRKKFEGAMAAMTGHLDGRGFFFRKGVESPNPDPLAWFNDHWNGEYERRHGIDRFERGPDGWPTAAAIGNERNRTDADGDPLGHGAVRYFRDRAGRLMRGRVYGGINGMWTVVYGPGRRDYTARSADELFAWRPGLARRVHPNRRRRIEKELSRAVRAMDFDRAKILRDILFADAPMFRIWSEKEGAWYAPQARGYVTDASRAGLYTASEAEREIGSCRHLRPVPVSPPDEEAA